MMHEHMTHYTHVQQQFNHHSQLHWIYKYPKSFHKLLCTELVLNWYGGQNLLLLMYGKMLSVGYYCFNINVINTALPPATPTSFILPTFLNISKFYFLGSFN